MSAKSEFVHRLIHRLGLSSVPVRLGRITEWAVPLIPLNHHFRRNDQVVVTRDAVSFQLNRSDYMQWYLWADLVDENWRHCLKYYKPGTHVIDVGSNIGAFALKVARELQGREKSPRQVVAVEANPQVAQLLRRQIELNPKLKSAIDVWEVALGDTNGTIRFSVDPANTGGGHVVNDPAGDSIEVPMKQLDDLVTEKGLKQVGVLKIDVEGFEPEVLAGAAELLKRDTPVLYLEVTDPWLRKRGHSALEMLTNLNRLYGYHFMIDHGHRLEPLEISPQNLERIFQATIQINVLGLPEDHK
jgi:FkbM family methyltransferase